MSALQTSDERDVAHASDAPRPHSDADSPGAGSAGVPVWTWIVHAAAILLALVPLPVARVRWEHLPDPYPTHFDASGTPDAWAPLSAGAVLLPVGIGMAAVLLTALAGVLVPRMPLRSWPGAEPESDPVRVRSQARGTAGMLSAVNIAVALVLCAAVLPTLLGLPLATGSVLLWAAIALLLVVTVGGALLMVRRQRRGRADDQQFS